MSGSTSIIKYATDIATAEAPPPLPAREYKAEIVAAEVRTASSGNNYLNLQCRVPAEQYPADFQDGDPDGTVLYYGNGRLSTDDKPAARYRMRRAMERIGGPLSQEIDCNALIGLWVNVEVVHSDYEGETRAQISKLLDP